MPLILVINIHPAVKITPIILGLSYCMYISIKHKISTVKSLFYIPDKQQIKNLVIKALMMMLGSTLLMYYFNHELLFIVVKKNWGLWIIVSLFYSIFSVYPQEFLYRTFFFHRYQSIFKRPYVLITVNAAFFSFAHIAFQNTLVTALTLIGGFLFATTYYKSKSLMLTAIEHAIYGSWLFTLGMGEMLAFPMPQS